LIQDCLRVIPDSQSSSAKCNSLAKFIIIKANEQPSVQTIITPRPPSQQSLPVVTLFEKAATVLWHCRYRHELPSRRSLKLQAGPEDMVRTPINGHFDAQAAKTSYVFEVMLSQVFRLGGAQYEIRREGLPTGNGTLEDAPHLQDAASQAAILALRN
jgi:hypothetical protein